MIPPPIRFLLLVIGAWGVGRAIVLSLPEETAVTARRHLAATTPPPLPLRPALPPLRKAMAAAPPVMVAHLARHAPSKPLMPDTAGGITIVTRHPRPRPQTPLPLPPYRPGALPSLSPAPVQARESRWGGSAWLFLRERAGASLAPVGSLGGSQAGGRVTYALAGRAALSARAYLPLEVQEEAEVAFGVDLVPVASLPVHVLLERREGIGRKGRSAFSATLYGGIDEAPVVGPVRLNAYAQAGMVGLRSRDLFVDGSARLHVRTGGIRAGAGIWGAAQPGAERLDIGPTLSLPTPIGTVQADWRFRIAGDARPGSGLAVTLATDF